MGKVGWQLESRSSIMLAERYFRQMLKITVTTFRGYIVVLKLKGRLALGETAKLRNTIDTVIRDHRRIIIDLGAVGEIDCAGLGELVSSYTVGRSAGAFFGLMNLNRRAHDLMVVTKLATVFPIIDPEVFEKECPKQVPYYSGAGSCNPKETPLLAGEIIAIQILRTGRVERRWQIGEVLEVSGRKIVLHLADVLLPDSPVQLSWDDSFILGTVHSCIIDN